MAPFEVGTHWPVVSADISQSGIGLWLGRRFEPGTLLTVSLADDPSGAVQMRLAWVRNVAASGAYWLLGCAWTDELSAEVFHTFLGPAAHWHAAPSDRRREATSLSP